MDDVSNQTGDPARQQPLHPPMSPLDVLIAPNGEILQDLSCLQCGYNLRGLHRDGACPECGAAIGRTLIGDRLRFANPQWVKTLATGMNWIVAAMILSFASACISMPAARQGGAFFGIAFGMAVDVIYVIGFWLFTTPDPGKLEDVFTLRSFIRFGYVVSTIMTLCATAARMMLSSPNFLIAVSIVEGGFGLLDMSVFIATFVYARRLAMRIPDESLARQTTACMWGVVALMGLIIVAAVAGFVAAGSTAGLGAVGIVGCGIGIGAIFVGLWIIVLVFQYRNVMVAEAQAALSSWAQSTALLPARY